MDHRSAHLVVCLALLGSANGCKLIDKIRNRGATDSGTPVTTTAAPVIVDAGAPPTIGLPNPTVTANPTEVPDVPAAPDPPIAPPVADADAGAVPAAPPSVDAGAAPTPTAAPAGGTIPESIAACQSSNTNNAEGLATCLVAIEVDPRAVTERDLGAIAEALYQSRANADARRKAYQLMNRYIDRYAGRRYRYYDRFKDRIDGTR